MKDSITLTVVLTIFLCLVNHGCSTVKSGANIKSEAVEVESVPMVREFILGAGDTIEISVYRQSDLNRTIRIDPSGKIMYPMVGDITAAGLSIFQLRDKISEGLSKYFVNPQVYIGIASVRSSKIIVLGEVNNPGFFLADAPMTALEVISRAGGFTVDGKMDSVLLIRGGIEHPELIKLNLKKTLEEGHLTQNIALQSGDIIYVPRATIANVEIFFSRISSIIAPIVAMESGTFIGQQITGRRGGATTSP